MDSITDEELMQQVAEGDLDELKILFERHHLHIFNFLHKMTGNRALSEDLTQEVFYKIMKYRATYSGGRFITWMFTIARNSLSTYYRQNKIYYENLDERKNLTETLVEESEDYSQLQWALNQMNTAERELLILNRLEEIKYKELAEIMGSTPGAVKTKVCRALKKLKTIYFEKKEL